MGIEERLRHPEIVPVERILSLKDQCHVPFEERKSSDHFDTSFVEMCSGKYILKKFQKK